MNDPVYLDNNASTPLDPAVLDAMTASFADHYGNPSNTIHAFGRRSHIAVEDARSQIAHAIGADPKEVFFTSGATESNNIATLGIARGSGGKPRHIVTSTIEHKSVLEPCRLLDEGGWRITHVPVDNHGRVRAADVESALTDETILVSVMAANNEVGSLQPIAELGTLCAERGVLFHCDAAQALGRMPIDVDSWNVDLLSLSAHKAYGPKGVGAIFVRGTTSRVALQPLSLGGGQESGLRSGTLPVPNIVGFGVAAELAAANQGAESVRLESLRSRLFRLLKKVFPALVVHGHIDQHLSGLLSVGFPEIDGDALIFALNGIAVSQGAACAAGSSEPSHVLTAMGVNYDLAKATIRFGIGRFTTSDEIDQAASVCEQALAIIS